MIGERRRIRDYVMVSDGGRGVSPHFFANTRKVRNPKVETRTPKSKKCRTEADAGLMQPVSRGTSDFRLLTLALGVLPQDEMNPRDVAHIIIGSVLARGFADVLISGCLITRSFKI